MSAPGSALPMLTRCFVAQAEHGESSDEGKVDVSLTDLCVNHIPLLVLKQDCSE